MIIAESLSSDIGIISQFEEYFAEYDYGELRIYVEQELTDTQIYQLEQDIIGQGVVLTEPISQDARIIVIKFQKAIAPLLIIGTAIAAIVSGIIGWQLFIEPLGIPLWVWAIGGAGLAYLIFMPSKKTTDGTTIHADRVYVGKRTKKK